MNPTCLFSTQATPALEACTGPGLCVGGMLRLSPRWRLNLWLGHVNVKTTATLTAPSGKLGSFERKLGLCLNPCVFQVSAGFLF